MSAPHRLQKFCILLFVFLPVLSWCQANVNENLETATVYVNGSTGSDSNPGTESQPLATISAAVSMAQSNNYKSIGTKVIIEPGTYREAVTIGKNFRTTSLPITLGAATNGTVIVSGADVWTGWSEYSSNSSIYTKSWPYQWGECAGSPTGPPQQQIVLRQEMVIVNGTPLTEVLALASMSAGTFFPDQANSTLYVWPPSGTNMSTATVEVATRPALFTDIGQSNLVLRGLTFQYANSCRMYSAVNIENNPTNVLIDTDTFQWNNGSGLSMTTPQYFTVKNSTANHNGQVGMASYQVKYGSWQSDVANYNNWRGAQGAFYSWDSAGFHFMLDHDGTFTGLQALYNQTFPVHFDTDNANVTMSSVTGVGNVSGFLLEKSEGPTSISGLNLCQNATATFPNNAGGLIIRDSTGLTLSSSTLYSNGTNALTLAGILGGIQVTNWETGQQYQLVTKNVTMTGNNLSGSTAAQVFSDGLGSSDWNTFKSTLSSGHNVWWAGSNVNAYTVPEPRSGTLLDFSDWQSTTGQDLSSTWSSVSNPSACQVSSSPDFMIVPSNVNAWTVGATGSASGTVTTMAMGNMGGTVNLSVQGLTAPGMTASFSPASIGTSGSSTLTLTTSRSTPAGNYTFTIVGSVGNTVHTVTLSLTVPRLSAVVSTGNLSFAGQGVGTTSTAQTVTLSNISGSALAIGSIQPGPNFGQTNNCGSSLQSGASCNINVTFSPHSTGSLNATMSINAGGSQTVGLSGTGVASADAKVAPTLLGFGLQGLGSKSTQNVTLSNKGGAAMSISKITISGAEAGDFSQTNNCGGNLGVGASCTITVTFSPAASGKDGATLNIQDNSSSSSQQSVTLQGAGK